MNKRITRIAPLQLGKVLAVLYGCVSLIAVPFLILASVLGAKSGNGGIPIVLALVFPIFYAIAGFIGGVIVAAIYNLIAGWTGGVEFTVEDVPQPGNRIA